MEVPIVVGWLRPVILIPASALTGLLPQQIEALLAHELAHIRRRDYLINLVQTMVETLLFYHPAMWWVSRQVRQERENCCDDMALDVCEDRLSYARVLATMEELRVPRSLVAAGGSSLAARIRRILGRQPNVLAPRKAGIAGMFIFFILLGGNIAGRATSDGPTSVRGTSDAPVVVSIQCAVVHYERYRGWHLDFDGDSKPESIGDKESSRNLLLTKKLVASALWKLTKTGATDSATPASSQRWKSCGCHDH